MPRPQRKFTDEDKKRIIELYQNCIQGPSKIATEFKCAPSAIKNCLLSEGIHIRTRKESFELKRQQPGWEDKRARVFSSKDLEKIINMYVNQKKGPSAICKEFNCSRSVIDRVLKEMNIQIRSRGEGVQATRLQPDYVDPRIGKIKADHAGKRIGNLENLGFKRFQESGYDKDRPIWKIRCSCGTEYEMSASAWGTLRSRYPDAVNSDSSYPIDQVPHCDRHPYHFTSARIGHKVGHLEVIDLPRNTGQKPATECQFLIASICTAPGCQNTSKENPIFDTYASWEKRIEVEARGKFLPSCGCRKSTTHGLSSSDDPVDVRCHQMHLNAKRRSIEDDLPYDIDAIYIRNLPPPEICPVLGIDIDYEQEDQRSDSSPSLDKFIPELGYVKGNVSVISWRANRMKSDGTPEEWRKIAKWASYVESQSLFMDKHADNIN
tara:strand:+ start:1249 stop:2553 length:1305 start_codon:yes stop_codon:yes gene_type:complete